MRIPSTYIHVDKLKSERTMYIYNVLKMYKEVQALACEGYD